MPRNITVGIDIGTFATRVIVAERIKNEKESKIIGAGSADTRGLRHGYVTNIEHAAESIKKAITEAEKAANIKINRAKISISGISLSSHISSGEVVISKADGEIKSHDIAKALDSSRDNLNILNREIISSTPILYKLDGKEILGRPEGMKGIKLEVKTLFVTALTQHIENLMAAVGDAGVEVVDIVPSPFAAANIALNERQKTAGCALVNIGAETVSIAVFENDLPLSLQVFPIGSLDITKDIALGFKIGLEEAENMKVSSLPPDTSKKKFENIVEARLSDIFELVESHLKKIKRSELLPAGIILTGGGSRIASIEDLSKALLKLPSKIANVDQSGIPTKVKDASWFVALGLALVGDAEEFDDGTVTLGSMFKNIKKAGAGIIKQLLP